MNTLYIITNRVPRRQWHISFTDCHTYHTLGSMKKSLQVTVQTKSLEVFSACSLFITLTLFSNSFNCLRTFGNLETTSGDETSYYGALTGKAVRVAQRQTERSM